MTFVKDIVFNGYTISADKSRIDAEYVHRYLSEQSYWAKGIPLQTVITSIQHAYCAGVYKGKQQVGFGRLITDYATFGYLADVFIDRSHRGQKLGKALVGFILAPQMTSGFRRLMLNTKDAHDLYKEYGFTGLRDSRICMEITRPEIYKKTST